MFFVFQAVFNCEPEYRFFYNRIGIEKEGDIVKDVIQKNGLDLRQDNKFRFLPVRLTCIFPGRNRFPGRIFPCRSFLFGRFTEQGNLDCGLEFQFVERFYNVPIRVDAFGFFDDRIVSVCSNKNNRDIQFAVD
jgi:hypothetical protein